MTRRNAVILVAILTCNIDMSNNAACACFQRFGLSSNPSKDNKNNKINRNHLRQFNNREKRGKRVMNDDHDERMIKGTRDMSTLAAMVWGSILAMNSGYM